MPGVLSATLKLLQIDLNTRTFQDLENALNSKVGKWIGASSMSMHRYHCHCHQVFLWSPKKSPRLRIIGTVSSWIYFGANKMDFKAIFKQSAKKEMLLCQRKAVANLSFSMKCVMEVCGKCSKTLCTFRKLSIDESLMKCYNYLMEFWIKMHKKNYHNSTQSSLTKNLFVFKRRLIKISVGRPMSHLKSITTQRADLSTPKKASQIHCPILKQQLQIAIDNDWTS